MQIYYINLDSQPKRRARIEWQMAELGLSAVRVPAVAPSDIDPAMIARYCPGIDLSPLSASELACTLSHAKALTIIAEGTEPFGVVLEDDAVLSKTLPTFLSSFESSRPKVDLVNMASRNEEVRVLIQDDDIYSGIALREIVSTRIYSTGYIVSKAGAWKIATSSGLLKRPIDVSLNLPVCFVVRGLVVRHADPGLCAQPHQLGAERESSIDQLRRAAWGKKGSPGLQLFRKLQKRLVDERVALHKTLREIAVRKKAGRGTVPLSSDLLWPIPISTE